MLVWSQQDTASLPFLEGSFPYFSEAAAIATWQ